MMDDTRTKLQFIIGSGRINAILACGNKVETFYVASTFCYAQKVDATCFGKYGYQLTGRIALCSEETACYN